MTQDFSKGKIYKITNDYNDDVYVGSTCDTLVKRFSSHKSHKKQNMNKKLNILINEIGIERFRIELIENYPCEDKYQLRQREGFWIRQIGTLNMMIAGRTDSEWHKETYEEKKEEILEKKKIYHRENRDKILQYQKEFRKNNPEIAKQRDEQRYLKFKEIILSQNKEKVICECGCEITKGALYNHTKSQKHLSLLADKTQHTIQS